MSKNDKVGVDAKITHYFKYGKKLSHNTFGKHQSSISDQQVDYQSHSHMTKKSDNRNPGKLTGVKTEITITVKEGIMKYTPNHFKGNFTLYNKRKGNSFYLIDVNNWALHTNNKRRNRQVDNLKFSSDKKIPNLSFTINKFLELFFKSQKVIPSRVRNKYWKRIKKLLEIQSEAIKNRLNKAVKNRNKETKTFFKFSYKHHTFYLGWWIPCNAAGCYIPVTCVKPEGNIRCYRHMEKTHTKKENETKDNNTAIDEQRVPPNKKKHFKDFKNITLKSISSDRTGQKYIKITKKFKPNVESNRSGLVVIKDYHFTHKSKAQERRSKRQKYFLPGTNLGDWRISPDKVDKNNVTIPPSAGKQVRISDHIQKVDMDLVTYNAKSGTICSQSEAFKRKKNKEAKLIKRTVSQIRTDLLHNMKIPKGFEEIQLIRQRNLDIINGNLEQKTIKDNNIRSINAPISASGSRLQENASSKETEAIDTVSTPEYGIGEHIHDNIYRVEGDPELMIFSW